MELELDLETLRTNSDGDDVVIYRFRPVEREARDATTGLKFDGVAVAGIGMVRFGMLRDVPDDAHGPRRRAARAARRRA